MGQVGGRHADTVEDGRRERRAEVHELVGQASIGDGRVVADRHPHARRHVDVVDVAARGGGALGDVRHHLAERLRRVQQGERSVGQRPGESVHAGRHRTEVDRRRTGGHAESRVRLPARPVVRGVGGRAAVTQRPDRHHRLGGAAQWRVAGDPGPAEHVGGPGGEAEEEAVAAQFLQRGAHHRDLGRMHRVGVEHAGAEPDRPRRHRRGGEHHRRRAEEQVVGHPDLVDAAGLGDLGQLDELVDADVVVDAHARAQRPGVHSSAIVVGLWMRVVSGASARSGACVRAATLRPSFRREP